MAVCAGMLCLPAVLPVVAAAERSPAITHKVKPAQALYTRYRGFIGSDTATRSLIQGLRYGELVKLGVENRGNTTFIPPTEPMGWVNIDHALAISRGELRSLGILHPSPLQLRAVLVGGELRDATGRQVDMPGILNLRSQGMEWPAISAQLGLAHARGKAGAEDTPADLAALPDQ